MFLNDWLSRRCLYTPQRVAVVDDSDGRRYSYGDLDTLAVRAARHLRSECGVQPGDRVACLSGNRLEYLVLWFACGKLGAVLVPLNFRLPAAAISELLADCRAGLLVYESSLAEVAAAASAAGAVERLLPMERQAADGPVSDRATGSQPQHTSSADVRSLAEVLAADDAPADAPPPETYAADEADVAMILYTSGTTGRAKGAMISYRQIHWNALNTIIGLQLTQDDVAFLNLPLYHTGGWHVLFTPLMLLGGRVVLQQRFDARRCNQQLGPEGITILFGVPTTLRMMWQADNFVSADFSRVRFAIFGGESCPLPVIEAYRQRGVAMRQGYGLTEAGPNCFSLPGEEAIRKQGSIGFPNFHIATRLVKADGQEAQPGEVGELWMKGPHVFAGYWNNPAETARTLRQGWLATGDLMTCDAEGYHYVVGRKKEMYVSGGENVYPAQVERVLQRHPAVASAAVVGMPDPRWGESGWAFVALRDGQAAPPEELVAWCKQHLAAYQCPAKLVMMDELPMGPSGKIDKLSLADYAKSMTDS